MHESGDLLVVDKPAGLVCHPTKAGALSSLIGRARLHLGDAAEPHLVNRLDRETSGLVMIAKTATAARELGRLWQTRRVEKEYVALVHGHVARDSGTIDAPIGKAEASRVASRNAVRPDGQPACTDYAVRRRLDRDGAPYTLLSLLPRTGRKHQLRVHLAHLGHAIVGDKIYGADEDDYLAMMEDRLTPERRTRLVLPAQALHARALRFTWRDVAHAFSCEPRASWYYWP